MLLNYAVSTLSLSNYFYLIYQYWQDSMAYLSRQATINTLDFKNAGLKPMRGRFRDCGTLAGSKPVRGRFNGCGTFTLNEALDT